MSEVPPRAVITTLDKMHREMIGELAAWLGTERFPEILRMGLRASWRSYDAARRAGTLGQPPVVPMEARGRRRGGPKRADVLADAVRRVAEFKRVGQARERWLDLTLAAGVDPSGEDAEARRWRAAWVNIEYVIAAKDPERQPQVQLPANPLSPGRRKT